VGCEKKMIRTIRKKVGREKKEKKKGIEEVRK
jgi:hypothetical protein